MRCEPSLSSFLFQVKNKDDDFGWGVVVNFQKKIDQSGVCKTCSFLCVGVCVFVVSLFCMFGFVVLFLIYSPKFMFILSSRVYCITVQFVLVCRTLFFIIPFGSWCSSGQGQGVIKVQLHLYPKCSRLISCLKTQWQCVLNHWKLRASLLLG